MKLATLRSATICLLLPAARLAASQAVALTLSPVDTHVNDTMRLKLLLHAPSDSAPAGLQWIFRIQPGLKITGIEAGTAVKKAGKTLVCNGAKCLVYGMNRTTISNGPIAIIKIKVDQAFKSGKRPAPYEADGRARMKSPEIQIGDPVGVSAQGRSITVVPGDGIAIPSTTP